MRSTGTLHMVLFAASVLFMLAFPAVVLAVDPGAIIDEIREMALAAVGPQKLGAGYAAMINFSVNPEISTATYFIEVEDVDDPVLKVHRFPYRHVFAKKGRPTNPFLQVNGAYQTLDAGFDITTDDSVDASWNVFGGSVTAGFEVTKTRDLILLPAVNAGLVRIESRADYEGVLANGFIKPALEGLVFDWEADAYLLGASLGADYSREYENFDMNLHGSFTYNYIETYHSSSGLIDFTSHVSTLTAGVETVHATAMSAAGHPLALVFSLGNTTFMGSDRDALGFDSYFEGGFMLEAGAKPGSGNKKALRAGAKLFYGQDVTGWSLVVGFRI